MADEPRKRDYTSAPVSEALGLGNIIIGLAQDLNDLRSGGITTNQAIARATLAKQIFNGVRLYLHGVKVIAESAKTVPRVAETVVIDRCLYRDFELRGQTFEIWPDRSDSSNRVLVDPRKKEVVDTDHAFTPPLTNEELLSIYDYGKGY